ncbi:DEAD/DEAH box helicase family protein [Candidatus Pseudothioglobus singularis]|nr:DEAD/DEAH box helicase family protein [Candidatus Pseudothioglobus singularis]
MKFNSLLKKRFKDWRSLELEIEQLESTYEKGDIFEQFVYAYLSINKQLYQIKEIYHSKEIPSRYLKKYRLEKKDSGVDGLIILNNKQSAAYQVKFRSGRKKPSYSELAKFWTEARFTDLNYIIANCYSVTNLSKKQEKHLQILVNDFDSLDANFFDSLFSFTNKTLIPDKYKPFGFQERIINDVIDGFQNSDRGKVIAACGTGKTLTALWITERMNVNQVLFLAPNIALIKQTLESWSSQSSYVFSYLAICSDKTVAQSEEDNGDIAISEMNIPVTTNIEEISAFLSLNKNRRKYIFSTYQSLPLLANIFKKINNFRFDLAIFDEAHRTAGASESNLFSMGLTDEIIPINKRLFMTATQRMLRPRLKKIAKDNNRLFFSMDDSNIYGNVFHHFNFGKAISQKIIADYEIIVAGMNESELKDWIRDDKSLEVFNANDKDNFKNTSAKRLFSKIILSKSINNFPIKKVISFHSSISNSKDFSGDSVEIYLDELITKINKSIKPNDLYIDHINGGMPASKRHEILDNFKNSDYGVITNSKCLTEGIDVPLIDSIYFVDKKNSVIDIIQACGRALRKPKDDNKKRAFFIIPILIPDGSSSSEIVNLDSFEMVFSVIQALRDNDNRMESWVNAINQNATKGRKRKQNESVGPLKFDFPVSVDLDDFIEKLYLKIANVNGNPTSAAYEPAYQFGKTERKSKYKRIFKTLGDYSVESYFQKLVDPTISKFTSDKLIITNIEAKVNNNNVSHTKRLGLIQKNNNKYHLTPLGKTYLEGGIDYLSLFKRQLLRYFSYNKNSEDVQILFPYRACLRIIKLTKSINFFEFSFGIYTLFDSSPNSIEDAANKIFELRDLYPNLLITNKANRDVILKELNDMFGSKFTQTDIWDKKTTVNNQFIYFRNHLSLFEEFINIENQTICLINKNIPKLDMTLNLDSYLDNESDYTEIERLYVNNF